MEKLLFVMAMVFLTMAVVSRKHVHRSIDNDASDETVVEENLKNGSENQPNSLAFAINQVSRQQNGRSASGRGAPGGYKAPNPVAGRPNSGQPPLSAEHIAGLIKEIQANNEQSVFALEKALTETSGNDQLAQRLSIFQAALSIGGEQNAYRLKDIAMHEMSTDIVQPVDNSLVLSPEELSKVETNRMIVNTAFKVYLNTSKSPDEVLGDTQQVLNFQQDPITRELIIYDCTARYPDLRGKLGEN